MYDLYQVTNFLSALTYPFVRKGIKIAPRLQSDSVLNVNEHIEFCREDLDSRKHSNDLYLDGLLLRVFPGTAKRALVIQLVYGGIVKHDGDQGTFSLRTFIAH